MSMKLWTIHNTILSTSDMIHTDKYYAQPTVYKIITCNKDKYITLDTVIGVKYDPSGYLPGTYLMPVSYVSSDAPNYFTK